MTDTFRRIYNKPKLSGSARKNSGKNWIWYEQMKFLTDVVSHKK